MVLARRNRWAEWSARGHFHSRALPTVQQALRMAGCNVGDCLNNSISCPVDARRQTGFGEILCFQHFTKQLREVVIDGTAVDLQASPLNAQLTLPMGSSLLNLSVRNNPQLPALDVQQLSDLHQLEIVDNLVLHTITLVGLIALVCLRIAGNPAVSTLAMSAAAFSSSESLHFELADLHNYAGPIDLSAAAHLVERLSVRNSSVSSVIGLENMTSLQEVS